MHTRQILTSLCLLLLCAMAAIAQNNTLTIPDVSVEKGKTIALPVNMDNTADVVAIQFTLTVPEGVTLAPSTAALSERADGHTLTMQPIAANKYMAMAFSSKNAPFIGRAGKIMSVKLTVSSSVAEGSVLPLTLSDVVIGGSDGKNLTTGYAAGKVTVTPKPDFAVSGVGVKPVEIMPGGTLSVNWKVANIGGVSTGAGWSEQVYLDTDRGDSKLLGTVYYDDILAAGGEVSRSADFILPQTLGLNGNATVRVKLTANSGAGEPEGLQDNNVAAASSTVSVGKLLTLSPPLADVDEASTGNVRFLLTRSGSTTHAETFGLSTTADSRLTFPSEVTIEKGQSGTYFYAQVKANKQLDNDSIVNLSLSGNGYGEVRASLNMEDDTYPSLSLSSTAQDVTEGGSLPLTVATERTATTDIEVKLACDHPSRFKIPSPIVIPAGSRSVDITVETIDDDVPNVEEVVTFTASANGHNAATMNTTLVDNDVPTLTLQLTPHAISEADGPLSVSARLSRTDNIDKKVTVKLSDDSDGAIYYGHQTVELAAGVKEVFVNLGPIDNAKVDGERTYHISAAVWIASCSCNASSGTSGGVVTAPLTVYDNDGPTLTLKSSSSVLKEGGEMVVTVSRNTDTKNALSVSLSSDHDSSIEYPSTVTIPAGKEEATFTVKSKGNDVSGDSFTAVLTASADSYAKGNTWFSVTDQTLPDAQITAFSLSATEAEVGSDVTAKLTLANTGSYALPELTKVGVYVSGILSKTLYLQSALAAGATAELTSTLTLPAKIGSYRIHAVANDGNEVKELTSTNNASTVITVKTLSPFTLTAKTDKAVYKKGETVKISGKITGRVIENQSVEVYAINDGYRHVINVQTASDGSFSTDYVPFEGQMGHFVVGACYPGAKSDSEMATFDIYGMKRTTNTAITCEALLGETYKGAFAITNPGSLPLSNIKATVVNSTVSRKVDLICPETIEGGGSVNVEYAIDGNTLSNGTGWEAIKLQIESSEGANIGTTLYYYCYNPKAQLQSSASSINTTMIKGKTRDYPITITNIGKGETGVISLALPTGGWIKAATPMKMPSLKNGEDATIVLQLIPQNDQQLNVPITGNIGINCENGNGMSLAYNIVPVSEEKGTLVVDVCDEWTYNTKEAPHVSNAEVMIKDINTGAVIAEGRTDEKGLFTVELHEGYYAMTVNADRHDPYTNNIIVDPGKETLKVVDLCYQAIEISYNLVETEIADEYKIEHVITYETNVPKPVVIITGPTSIDGEAMAMGEKKLLYFTLTNKGLVRSENVRFNLPESTKEWAFEALAYTESFPLSPNQSVIIPVLLTHYPETDRSQVGRQTSGPDIMGACMAEMTSTYEVLCNGKLSKNESAHRMAMKACATSAILNAIAQGVGVGGIGGGSGTPAPTGPGPVPGTSKPSIIDPTEAKKPVELQSDKTICDPCYADLMNKLLDDLLDKIPGVKFINDGANIAYDKARHPEKRLRKLILDKIKEYIDDNDPDKPDSPSSDFAEDISNLDKYLAEYEECKREQRENVKSVSRSNDELTNSWIQDFWQSTRMYKAQIYALKNIWNELLGDSVWYLTKDQSMRVFWNKVIQYDQSIPLEYERLLPYKPTSVSTEQLKTLLKRLNETSDNIIDTEALLSYANEITALDEKAVENGYDSMTEMFWASQEDFNTKSSEESKLVCSTISLRFDQQMIMTRQAFRGTLNVFNSNKQKSMEKVQLSVFVTDENGNVATEHEFQITPETLKGFTGELNFTDGWALAAGKTGEATVLFIPTKYAAPTADKKYSFGGSLSYIDPYTGLEVTRDLSPVTLTVKPSPNLNLTYFMQRDILGDDPLTEAVEPSKEAEFSLLINNVGYGDATNVRMTTNQPEIVENEKGLKVDFELMNSQLNGGDKTLALGGSVATEFGTIPAQSTSYAQWWIKSSLLGHFTDYDVKATHMTSYGNENLSLLNEVNIHELIRSIDIPHDDGQLVGFLTNDIVDADDTPDMLYLSNGTAESVSVAASSVLTKKSDTEYELTITPSTTGWNYGNLNDPSYGQSEIKSIVRKSDGKEISAHNFWQTDRTLRDGKDPLYENRIHFAEEFNSLSAETYTLTFDPLPNLLLEVVAIEGVPAEDSLAVVPVPSAKVVFNKPIDPATFAADDITLSIQGQQQNSSLIGIETDDNKTFTLNFSEVNKAGGNGYHTLTVQTSDITDGEGYKGQTGKSVGWIMFREGYIKLLTSAYPANSGTVKRSGSAETPKIGKADATDAGENVDYGSTIRLTAEANKGYEFTNWTLDGEIVSTQPTYECTALGDMDVVAHFSKKNYDVTIVTEGDGGTVVGNDSGIYPYEERLMFVAQPDEKFVFEGWFAGGKKVGGTDTLRITVNRDTTLTARFVRSIYEQRMVLKSGWNWVSTYLKEAQSLDGLLTGANRILSQFDELVYDPEYGMVGQIDSIASGKAYKVENVYTSVNLMEGHLLDPVSTPISLKKGWNWVAYPYYESRQIVNTIADAMDGDVIASQTGFAEYANGAWEGTLETLNPGSGYLYKSASDRNLTFDFTTAAEPKASTAPLYGDNQASEATVDIYKYPHTMNVTARLYQDGKELTEDKGYIIYAMAGNELRGIGKRVGENYYITVYGEDAADITFVVEDAATNDTYLAAETLRFRSDVVGSRKSPFTITLGDANSIDALTGSDHHKMRIYSIQGYLLYKDATRKEVSKLPKGIYIIDGRKYIVK